MQISRLELALLVCVIFIGGFLRLYRLADTAMFLGDQGRDAIIAKNIFTKGDLALIGPVTSVGNMYLGPFYYYFMVPFLYLSYPNPIGPAIAVALIGTATIVLIYFIGRRLFGSRVALYAATMFALSNVAINQVRFSWNPNVAPTVGLLLFYSLYRFVRERNPRSLIWSGLWFSLLAQLHYMALVTAGVAVVVVLWQWYISDSARLSIFTNSLKALGIFTLSLLPLVAFDVRHNGLISGSFSSFFTSSEQHLLPIEKLTQIVENFTGGLFKLLPQMVGSYYQSTHIIMTILIVITAIWMYRTLSKSAKTAITIFGVWFIISALGIGAYSSSVFVHYLSFSQAVSLLFIGGGVGFIAGQKNFILSLAASLALFFFATHNLSNAQAFEPGQSHIARAKAVAQTIYERVGENQPYNIVLISGTGDIDAQNYRYFLETTDRPPVQIQRRGEAELLFIIQEDYFDTNPVDSPIYEIVTFPDKQPKEVYTIQSGPTVTVLQKV